MPTQLKMSLHRAQAPYGPMTQHITFTMALSRCKPDVSFFDLRRECWKDSPANYLIHTFLDKMPDNQGITLPPFLDADASMQAEPLSAAQQLPSASQLPHLPEPPPSASNAATELQRLLVHKDADVMGMLTVTNFFHLSDERKKENIATLQTWVGHWRLLYTYHGKTTQFSV